MKNLSKNVVRTVVLVCIAYVLVGCIDGEAPWAKNDSPPNTPPALEESYVSIYQVSPGASGANIVVDDNVINKEPLDYGQHASYLRVKSGSTTMKLRVAGQEVAQAPINLVKDQTYSIFLVGDTQPTFLVAPNSADNIKPGFVRVRFMNLSPDAPEANLVEDSSNKILFSGMSFKETSEFIEIPAQLSYDVTVKSTADNSVLMQIPAMKLYDGWTYTILLRGYNSTTADPSVRLSSDVLAEVQR